MKTFEDICRMTQQGVKGYMHSYLVECGYSPTSEDGFLYAKGDVPVMLVAHMDTVHKEQCKDINNNNGKLSSPQGNGGDDRAGVYILMNIVKELHCSILLCEDEEIGCVGAKKFIKTDYIKNLDVNYMIEFDRKGNNDAVFYSCANEDFIDFVEDATNFKFATGSVSDISVLMPEANLSAVNLSCGYYNAHTLNEYVIYDEMMDTIEAAKALIKEKCDKPFVYVRKTYSYSNSYANFNNYHAKTYPAVGDYYGSFFDEPDPYEREDLAAIAKNDKYLELEAVIYAESLSEEVLYANGDTKAECWMNLFMDNPSLCFNDIVDYSWS